MSTTISQRELRNQSADVIRRLQAGESFVLTNKGVPVAEIRPIHGPKRFVRKEDLLAGLANVPPYGVSGAELKAELDEFVDQTVRDGYTGEPV